MTAIYVVIMITIMMLIFIISASAQYPDNDEIKRWADEWNVAVDKCRKAMDNESKDP